MNLRLSALSGEAVPTSVGMVADALPPEIADHIVRQSPEIIVHLNHEGRVLYVNDAVTAITGYDVAELLGQSWWPIFYPGEKMRQIDKLFEELSGGGEVRAFEVYVETKAGEDRLIRWNTVNRFADDGSVHEIIGIGEDVTQHRAAETALQRSKDSLAEAQRVARLGSWELDHRTNRFHWSMSALSLFGVTSPDELRTYGDFLGFLSAEERDRLDRVYQHALRTREPYEIVYPITTAHGVAKFIRGRCETEYADDGAALYSIGTVQDITEQVHQEEQLRELLRETQDLQQYNDHIVRSSPAFIVRIAPDGTTLSVNDAGCEISGYSRDRIVGLNFWETMFPGQYRKQADKLLEHFRRRGSVHNHEMILRARSEQERTLAWTSANRYDDNGMLTEVICVGQDITELRSSQHELQRLAHHDPLTGLPNRLYLSVQLESAITRATRRDTTGALLFIDIDRFKNINDSLGHLAGDELLIQASRRLSACVRADDTVARIGGDEFTLLLEGLSDPENAVVVARKVLDAFEEPYILDGHDFHVTPSIGISLFPRDGTDIDTLLRNADTAMYKAKGSGRNAFAMYDASLTVEADSRATLENQLRRALDRGELFLEYQPQVDLASGALLSMEALLRWNHPELGLVPPGRFIQLAEDSGLIIPIGEWVLQEACEQARIWLDAGLNFERIAVNVAGPQIAYTDIYATCRDVLDDVGLPAERLELEVTEGFIMDKPGESIDQLRRLRDMGIFLAIDDFGTGYSSLSYLKRLPLNQIKIDQSFVRDIPNEPEDIAITQAVIALAHSLELKVLAEGVETDAQRQFLIDAGCSRGQGYLFSKPIAADELFEIACRNAGCFGALETVA